MHIPRPGSRPQVQTQHLASVGSFHPKASEAWSGAPGEPAALLSKPGGPGVVDTGKGEATGDGQETSLGPSRLSRDPRVTRPQEPGRLEAEAQL